MLAATKVVGVELEFAGKIGGLCGVAGMFLLYPAGILADRFHPLRVLLVAAVAQVIIGPLGITFMFTCHHFSLDTAKGIYIALCAIGIPVGTLYGAAELPMFMKLLPKDRYGQFCSANAMIRSVALIIGGIACGAFLDLMQKWDPTPDSCYRFGSVWNLFFNAGCAFFLFLLYREWKRMGGMSGYQPPRPDLPDAAASEKSQVP